MLWVGMRIKTRQFRHAGNWANMLILKNTASKSGSIFQHGRRKQDGTLGRWNDTGSAVGYSV